jgi:hypothetical protein
VILADKSSVLLGKTSGERCCDEPPGLGATARALEDNAVALNDTSSIVAAQ